MSHSKILHNLVLIFVLFNSLLEEKSCMFFLLHCLCGVACSCICKTTYGRFGRVFDISLKFACLFSIFLLYKVNTYLLGFRVVDSICCCLSSSGSHHRPRLLWLYCTCCAFMGCRAHSYNTRTNSVTGNGFANLQTKSMVHISNVFPTSAICPI